MVFAPDSAAGSPPEPSRDPAPDPAARQTGQRLVRFGHGAEPGPPAAAARPVPAAPSRTVILHPALPAAPPGQLPQRPPAAIRPRRDPVAGGGGDLVTFGQSLQARRRGLGRGGLRQFAGTVVGGAIALAMLLQRDIPGFDDLGDLAAWIAGLLALAGGIGLMAGILARRGWGVIAVPLLALLLPLHPIAVMAVQGDVALIATLGGILVLGLMLDRLEAVGDLRSLMGFGLALAILLPLAPQSAPGALLAIAMLPVACRDMRDPASALGVFLLALLPAVAVLLAIRIIDPAVLDGLVDQLQGNGAAIAAILPVPWRPLHPAAPLLNLGALLLLAPPLLLVLRTLSRRTAERSRPVTALFALAIGPVTLLATGLLGHGASLPMASAASLAGVLAWTMATRLAVADRGLWVMLAGLGVALGWGLLWFTFATAARY